MHASRFLDTNILLYAYDLDAPAKRATAVRWVERASGASELITEDLSHGQNYGGVKVVNPFL